MIRQSMFKLIKLWTIFLDNGKPEESKISVVAEFLHALDYTAPLAFANISCSDQQPPVTIPMNAEI